VLVALGGGVGLASLPAFAQQTSERVEITGSRIKSIQSESASPVVSLGAEAIRTEGVRNVETLLNNLPQVFADQGAQVSNGATGTATVNLRNFGSSRTLVLVNGRRLPAGSPRDVSADLTQIPIGLIKRVEVLTGGASAIYGSDAVSGVINFILEDSFSGVQVDLNTQFYNHKQKGGPWADATRARNFNVPGNKSMDGEVHDVSVLLGGNFDAGKGNAVVFLGYKKEEALLESERDFSACALNYTRATNAWSCGGSGTSFPGRFTDFDKFNLTMNSNGSVRNFAATDQYNYAPLNYFQRPSERFIFNATARYDVNPFARVYAEMGWMDNKTVAQIAPSGVFGTVGTGGAFAVTARNENPLITPAWKTALGITAPGSSQDLYIYRRNVEGGPRQDTVEHSSYRSVIGVNGEASGWSYDASAQFGRVLFQETYLNDFSNTRAQRALDVVTNPANGQAVCRSALDGTDPNCVPYNVWSYSAVTPAALAYISIPLFQRGFTQQSVLQANASADLGMYGIKSPWATSGVGVVFGAERRNERLELKTDANFTSGDGAGQGGPTIGVGGNYGVTDIFTEVRVPIMQKQPLARLLSVSGSARSSDYSTGKKTNTYGLGLEYMPIEDVKLRGSYQRAARAPNIIELFSAQSIGLFDGSDPCSGATPTATQAQCAQTGVTAAQYGKVQGSPAGQYNQITGGNTNLKPEKAKSFTFGFAVSPVRDLTLTLDYFDIKIDDVVSFAPSPQILQKCLSTGNPALCGLIHRDNNGTLWATPNAYILSTNANLSQKSSSGIDIGADYRMGLPAGWGKLDFSFIGTKLQKFETEDFPGSGKYDCAGLYGDTCGTPLPKWRHKLRTTWTTPWDGTIALTWRHVDSVTYEGDTSNPVLAPGSRSTNVAKLDARDYLDVAVAYTLTKNFTLRAFVNNLLDKDPPVRLNGAGFVNGNTYPVVYDALGRKVGLSLTAKF
jgi:outer membrane receptor protein involved in Fe transport